MILNASYPRSDAPALKQDCFGVACKSSSISGFTAEDSEIVGAKKVKVLPKGATRGFYMEISILSLTSIVFVCSFLDSYSLIDTLSYCR